jgi:hypothetical protein
MIMTILFLSDWDLHQNSIIHTSTTNESFLRLAALYRDMGVKNHAFILALHNPDLRYINPFDPSLGEEEILMIAHECKTNFWYWLREIARAPGRSSAHGIPIRANRGNIALYWLFWNHITVMLIQIRQTGKSFGVDLLYTYLANIRCLNIDINIVTKDETLRSYNLERLKEIEQELPYYLKMRRRGEVGNTEEIKISALGNTIKAHLPNKSAKMALGVGRGLTSTITGFDEAAFLSNIEITLPAALAAGTAARDIARNHNEPYGTLITTTAGKKDDRDGRYIFNMLMHSAIYSEMFFDAQNIEELQTIIRKNSPPDGKKQGALRVNCTFNHRQLGLTDAWLSQAIEESEAVGDAADRDFFNVWTSGSQTSPFSTEASGRIRESEKEPLYNEISISGYITRWHIEEKNIAATMANTFCTIGLDTSEACGGDGIGMTIRNIKTGGIVAAGGYNETNLITFADFIVAFMLKYENTLLVPERRSTGAMLIDYIIIKLVAAGVDPFKRIYNKVVQEAAEKPERFAEINKPLYARDRDIYTQHKKTFGFATSGSGTTSRDELYSTTLQSLVKYTGDFVYDKPLINQMLGLVSRNGRIDHAEGEHDDYVIAWLLSGWVVLQGRNLNFYGIDSRDIFADNQHKKVDNSPDKLYFRQEQHMLRREIESIIEKMKGERDEFIVQKLEARLIALSTRLVLEDTEVFSVDALLRDLRDRRKVAAQPAVNYGQYQQYRQHTQTQQYNRPNF